MTNVNKTLLGYSPIFGEAGKLLGHSPIFGEPGLRMYRILDFINLLNKQPSELREMIVTPLGLQTIIDYLMVPKDQIAPVEIYSLQSCLNNIARHNWGKVVSTMPVTLLGVKLKFLAPNGALPAMGDGDNTEFKMTNPDDIQIGELKDTMLDTLYKAPPSKLRKLLGINESQVGGTHYKDMEIQPWEVMGAWGPNEHFIGFLRFCILKRLGRWDSKDSALLDMRKARHEMDKLIELLESNGE